jgi:predicted Zn finger-like uncharacterized protein
MKIACQSCQAKYTIADEKVLGRVVKIRCKKCSSTIVINGNEAADTALSPPDDPTALAKGSAAAYDYSAPQGDEWTVNVAEGDQRTMRLQEIVAQHKSGVVNDETYCWKDGMNDWLPLREIPALASACAPAVPSRFTSQAPTAVVSAPENPAFAASGGGGYGAPAATNGNGSAGAFAKSTATSTARRAGGRGAPGADLFGNVADAGGENDVMTSAPQGTPEAHDNGEAKLTGQRNENSVLFSLSALTSNAPQDNGAPSGGAPQQDGSGLIDIRALAGSMSSGPKEKASRVDDIMNLGGGGAFTAALAAPVLAAPPMESELGAGASQGSNKGLMIAMGGVVVALLLVVVVLLVRKPAATADTGSSSSAAALATAPTAPTAVADTTPVHSAAAADSAAPPTTAAPPDTATAKPAPIAMGGRTTGRTNANPGNASPGVGAPPPPPPATEKPSQQPSSFEDAIKKSVAAAPAPAPAGNDNSGSSAQFDRGAAAAALGAVNVQSCKKPDGPTGSGHVSITFAPNGSVSNVVADQPPYQGTAVGGCVAAKFRTARVPAFGGGAQRVGKSFSLN